MRLSRRGCVFAPLPALLLAMAAFAALAATLSTR